MSADKGEKKNPVVFYRDSALMETFWKKGGSNIAVAETMSSISSSLYLSEKSHLNGILFLKCSDIYT